MPFIIPNATDTTSGNRYAALDQAEPDSLDFEILGNDSSGVMSGCEVVATVPASGAVVVSSGLIVLNNLTYPVIGQTISLNAAPGNNRFDLVVARVANNASTASLVVISGQSSLSNPTFPKSRSRLTSTELSSDPAASTHINPATDVVLAAVYRAGATSVTNAHIVDKRSSVKSNISFQGTSDPSADTGNTSDLYYRTTNRVSSGVYVKHNDNTWDELAKYPIDPGVPIGSMIMWPAASNPNPAVWVEANGATVSRTGAYANLFAVLATTYGNGDGSGNTFSLPDFRGFYLAGLPANGSLGSVVGNPNNNVTLNSSQLPAHTHAAAGLSVDVAESHAHTIQLSTAASLTGAESGKHTHTFSATTSSTVVATQQNPETPVGTGAGYLTSNTIQAQSATANNVAHSHTVSGTTADNSGGHTHTIPELTVSGTSGNAGGHSHNVLGNTSSTGSNASVNIAPQTYYIRYFLRYA